jgi:PEP-CTERM motif
MLASTKRGCLTAASLGLMLILSSRAEAGIVINGLSYTGTGTSEALTATADQPDGGITTQSYSGYVDVVVSGIGTASGITPSDPFYLLSNPPSHSSTYTLAFGTSPLTGWPTGSPSASNAIVYDVDAGMQVTAPYFPAYRSDHTYDVVLNTGTSIPSLLHFGIEDGNYADNSGAYTIKVTQLVAAAIVPEPSSLALAGIASLLVISYARHRHRAA